jgi:hypothetical protein
MLQETQNYRQVSAISYNKLEHITRGFSPDGKTKKEILV